MGSVVDTALGSGFPLATALALALSGYPFVIWLVRDLLARNDRLTEALARQTDVMAGIEKAMLLLSERMSK